MSDTTLLPARLADSDSASASQAEINAEMTAIRETDAQNASRSRVETQPPRNHAPYRSSLLP